MSVRFADDFVAGFQHLGDAKQFLKDLRERFAKFSLELHPGKTRLIEFGRFAAQHRSERGLPKPETFYFLGFTQIPDDEGRALLAPAHHHPKPDAGGNARCRNRAESQ